MTQPDDARWLRPLGGVRAQLSYRLLGWVLLTMYFERYAHVPIEVLWGPGQWLLHVFALLSLILAVFGMRAPTLLALSAVCATIWGTVFSEDFRLHGYGQLFYVLRPSDEEWAAHTLLIVGGGCLAAAAWLRAERNPLEGADARRVAETEWGVLRLFRLVASGALLFAGLHKLNADFFDMKVSCLRVNGSLGVLWGAPEWLYGWLQPAHIAGAEIATAICLWLVPRVGILMAIALLTPFGSVGATVIAGFVISASLGFLPEGDEVIIARGFRRLRVPIMLCVLLVTGLSRSLYRGPDAWFPFGLFHAGIGLVVWAVGLSLHAELVRRRDPSTVPVRHASVDLGLATRALVATCALLVALNGVAPYLGLKFRYSFAMYSNLRVDDARWNSLVFPKSVRLTDHDAYVHVSRVRALRLPEGTPMDPRPFLTAALYTTTGLRARVRSALGQGVELLFDLSYAKMQLNVNGPADAEHLYTTIDAMPDRPAWQEQVSARGPQDCTH